MRHGQRNGPRRILYLTYWGATELIGSGNAVPTVIELANRGYEVFYITFDKPRDLARGPVVESVRNRLVQAGVRWFQLTYHKSPRNLSTAYDIFRGYVLSALLIRRFKIPIFHGRTYVGAVIGMLLRKSLGVSFVCHPDGHWPGEQVDNGFWSPDSKAFCWANRLLGQSYRWSDEIIVLSRRVVDEVEILAPELPVTVIHTPVDLNRISLSSRPEWRQPEPFRLVYLGAIGGRYLETELFRFLAVAQCSCSSLEIRIVTQSDPGAILMGMSKAGVKISTVKIGPAESSEVGGILNECDAAVFMLMEGLSNTATSATKVGEYWAAGLPVVLTKDAGDLDLVAQENNVGVVIVNHTDESYKRAFQCLVSLTSSPGIRFRCREVAKQFKSISAIGAAHEEIYERILARNV